MGLGLLWAPSGPWEDRQDTFQRAGCHSRKLGLLATWVWCDQSQVPFLLTLDVRKYAMGPLGRVLPTLTCTITPRSYFAHQ